MQHPYLFFSGADIERFRDRIGTDAAAKERYEKAVEKAEEYLTEPFVTWEHANGSETQHANFGSLNGQANKLCDCLGLKYLVEDDERCAKRLKELKEELPDIVDSLKLPESRNPRPAAPTRSRHA